jgi:hypothetical protein
MVIGWAWRRSIMLSKGITVRHFSPCAGLAALGVKLRALEFFGPIRERVQIQQKTVKDTPAEKLYDAFITMLAGAHGMVEINTRLAILKRRRPTSCRHHRSA